MVVGFVQTSSWIPFVIPVVGGARASWWAARLLCHLSERGTSADRDNYRSSACWWRRGEEFFVARGNGRASRYTLSKGLLATDIICAEHK